MSNYFYELKMLTFMFSDGHCMHLFVHYRDLIWMSQW